MAFAFTGKAEETIASVDKAIELSHNDPLLVMWLSTLSLAYYQLRGYERAREVADVATQRGPHYPLAQRAHASELAQLSRLKEARAALAKFLELAPGYT